MASYLWYVDPQSQFLVLSKRCDRFHSLYQKISLWSVGSPLMQSKWMDTKLFVLFYAHPTTCSHSQLSAYSKGEVWEELARSHVRKKGSRASFTYLFDSVTCVLGNVPTKTPITGGVENDQDNFLVTMPHPPEPPVTHLFPNLCSVFSEVIRA